jgi:hypothetical protein
MKKLFLLLAAAALSLVPATSMGIDSIKILPTPVKLDSSREVNKGNANVETKEIAYTVKVTSSSFSEVTDTTVKYNIFYEVSELGRKGDPDIKLSTGSHLIPSLLTNKSVEFETDRIKLEKTTLDSGWYFGNGASSKTRDKVVGVWFKAFDSTGKQIGEYINPTTLSNKQKWKD